jgi:hypothetical protein
LKNHANLQVAELLKLSRAQSHDVDALDFNFSGRWFQQPIEMTDQCGLSATGQTHDAENFASVYGKADVCDANDCVVLGENFGLSQTLFANCRKGGLGVGSEYLPDVGDFDDGVVSHNGNVLRGVGEWRRDRESRTACFPVE